MDSFLLNISRRELERFKGFYVSGLRELSKSTFELILSRKGEKVGVILSINPSMPRIYPVIPPITGDPPSSDLLRAFRRKLLRKRLTDITLPPFERVITLTFDGNTKIVHEILGRFSSVYLIEEEIIKLTFGKRRKGLSKKYVPPTLGESPLSITRENFREKIRSIHGIPKQIAKNIKSYEDLQKLIEDYEKGTHPLFGNVDLTEHFKKTEELEKEEIRRSLENEVNKRLEKLKKSLERLEREKESLQKKLTIKKIADILSANLYRVKKGDSEIELEDPETGEMLKIKLDPTKRPSETLQDMYETYKKAKSGLEKIKERIARIKEIMDLEEKMPVEIEGQSRSFTASSSKELQNAGVKKLKSPGGFTVYVGLNARGNEEIVRKIGSPNDLWFHLRENKGPHVLIKLPKGKKPSKDDIAFAATLALGKRKGKFKVDYTELKFVKKPPGSPKGFFVYTKERTLIVHGS